MNMQKLTKKSLEAVDAAQSKAIEYQNMNIAPEHMLYALVDQENGLIPQLISKLGAEPDTVKAQTEKLIEEIPRVTGSGRDMNTVYISTDCERCFNAAEAEAKRMGDEYVSVEHLFMGILSDGGDKLKKLFKSYGIDKNAFLKALSEVRGNQRVTNDSPEDTYDVLKKYGQDLVALAKNNKLDPVIGRDTEIRNVIRILSRKTKNNPVLIGEPGVGKTAIAEGLAQRIVRGDVPDNLKDRKLFSLDMGALISGAKFRGEFESRTQRGQKVRGKDNPLHRRAPHYRRSRQDRRRYGRGKSVKAHACPRRAPLYRRDYPQRISSVYRKGPCP